MVTSIRKGARAHLYIEEWMEVRGLSAQRMADRLNVARPSVYRWINEQHRLTPDKILGLAEALDITPEELWRPPGRRSIDALVKTASDEDFNKILDLAERWIKRA